MTKSHNATALRFGKYAGVPIQRVPGSYLRWCRENMTNAVVLSIVEKELSRRDPTDEWVNDWDEDFGLFHD